jgi:hypothetical protein
MTRDPPAERVFPAHDDLWDAGDLGCGELVMYLRVRLRAMPGKVLKLIAAVNQKHARVETADEIVANVERAIALFGPQRVLLNPDCGFATFADNPVSSAGIAEAKLAHIAAAAERLRSRHHLA